MKPFTLEWWFTKYEQAKLRERLSFNKNNTANEIQYSLLSNWIQRRNTENE